MSILDNGPIYSGQNWNRKCYEITIKSKFDKIGDFKLSLASFFEKSSGFCHIKKPKIEFGILNKRHCLRNQEKKIFKKKLYVQKI